MPEIATVQTTTKDVNGSESNTNHQDSPETASSTAQSNKASEKTAKGSQVSVNGTKKANEEPSNQLHEKTKCGCQEHYPNTVLDMTYRGSLEKIYKALFHSDFLETFLVDNQKSTGRINTTIAEIKIIITIIIRIKHGRLEARRGRCQIC